MIWAQGYKGPVSGLEFVVYAPKGTRPSKVEVFRSYLGAKDLQSNAPQTIEVIDPYWRRFSDIRMLPGQAILANNSEQTFVIVRGGMKKQVVLETISEVQGKQARLARRNRDAQR